MPEILLPTHAQVEKIKTDVERIVYATTLGNGPKISSHYPNPVVNINGNGVLLSLFSNWTSVVKFSVQIDAGNIFDISVLANDANILDLPFSTSLKIYSQQNAASTGAFYTLR